MDDFRFFALGQHALGTLRVDNEMHDDDDVRNPRRTGSRVSFSERKATFKQCVVLKRRRLLVR